MKRKSGTIVAPKTVGILAAVVVGGVMVAAATSEDVDDVAYCVDDQNTVVAESDCDNTSTGTGSGGTTVFLGRWFVVGPYQQGLAAGTRLDPTLATNRVSAADSAARSAAGIAGSGRQVTGKSVTGKTGGFGSGLFNGKGFGG